MEEVPEELPQVRVVRLVVEPQRAAQVEVRGELGWEAQESDGARGVKLFREERPLSSVSAGLYSHGYPLQSTSMGVDIFFSLMRSYFCLLVAALSPCQGREPRLKYMST